MSGLAPTLAQPRSDASLLYRADIDGIALAVLGLILAALSGALPFGARHCRAPRPGQTT